MKRSLKIVRKNGLSEEDGDFDERKGHTLTDLETVIKNVNPFYYKYKDQLPIIS